MNEILTDQGSETQTSWLLHRIGRAKGAIGHDQAVAAAGNVVKDPTERTADLVIDGIPGANGKDRVTCDPSAIIFSLRRRIDVPDIYRCRIRTDGRVHNERGGERYGERGRIAAFKVLATKLESGDIADVETRDGFIGWPGRGAYRGSKLAVAAAAIAFFTAANDQGKERKGWKG